MNLIEIKFQMLKERKICKRKFCWKNVFKINRIRAILMLFVFFSFSQCKKEKNQGKDFYKTNLNEGNKTINNEVDFLFLRKGGKKVNTFCVDSTYLVVLKYKGDLDSITEKIYRKNYPERQLYYYSFSNQNLDLSSKTPSFLQKRNIYDTIYASDNRNFFFEVKFDKEGVNYINGIIDDFVYLKDFSSKKDSSKLRMISNKIVVSKKMFVNLSCP